MLILIPSKRLSVLLLFPVHTARAKMLRKSRPNLRSDKMLIDPVLDHIEERIKDTIWLYEEIGIMNIRQVAAMNEMIQSALTDTRKHFKNAVIGVSDE
jgi:hypothetical protein